MEFSIPSQFAKKNRKFIYGLIREGARAKDFELVIQWLQDCGLIHKSYRVKKYGMSLISYMEMSIFKIFMVDIGLLAAKVLLEGNQIFEEFKGALTEQFVAQELSAYGLSLYYYSITNSKWKIDFVIQKEQYCIPIEVKAEENLRAKSLKVFCEKYHPEIALRTSMSDYRKEDTFINVPLYSLSQYISNIQ